MSLWKNKCGGEKNYSKHVKVYFKVVKEEKMGVVKLWCVKKKKKKKWHMEWKKNWKKMKGSKKKEKVKSKD